MKKYFLMLTLLILLTSCRVPEQISSGISSSSSSQGIENDSKTHTPSSYTRPDSRADISGTIKSIIGNEITVSGRDMSEIFGDESQTDFREKMATMKDTERTKMREAMNNAKTINTKVTIPVGIAMGKRVVTRNSNSNASGATPSLGSTIPGGGGGFGGMRGGSRNLGNTDISTEEGGTIQEASLADLKIGLEIAIWLDTTQKDRKIAENALITEIKTTTNQSK